MFSSKNLTSISRLKDDYDKLIDKHLHTLKQRYENNLAELTENTETESETVLEENTLTEANFVEDGLANIVLIESGSKFLASLAEEGNIVTLGISEDDELGDELKGDKEDDQGLPLKRLKAE